eukprot:321572-Rhodomonas_salina.1
MGVAEDVTVRSTSELRYQVPLSLPPYTPALSSQYKHVRYAQYKRARYSQYNSVHAEGAAGRSGGLGAYLPVRAQQGAPRLHRRHSPRPQVPPLSRSLARSLARFLSLLICTIQTLALSRSWSLCVALSLSRTHSLSLFSLHALSLSSSHTHFIWHALISPPPLHSSLPLPLADRARHGADAREDLVFVGSGHLQELLKEYSLESNTQ